MMNPFQHTPLLLLVLTTVSVTCSTTNHPSINQLIEELYADWMPPSMAPAAVLVDPLALLDVKSPLPAVGEVSLALTGNPTECRVMWVTPTANDSSIVVLGTEPTLGNGTTFYGSSHTYTVPPSWFNAKYNKDPPYIHDVLVSGLQTDTTYYYKAGSPAAWSSVFSFVSSPPSSPATPTDVVVYGDQGVIPLGFLVTDQMVKDLKSGATAVPDMFALVGDISYAGIDTKIPGLFNSTDEIERVWDTFGNQIQPLTSKAPFMVTKGNHDNFYGATAFRHRYHMPDSPLGSGNTYYNYSVGNVAVVSMSTEDPYTPGSPQYEFIESALAYYNADRESNPWLFFFGHRPMMCSDASEYAAHHKGGALQRYLEPLLVRYGVNLAVWGHEHCYEATHPVVNDTVTQYPVHSSPSNRSRTYKSPSSPIHLTVGTAGALQEEKWTDPQPVWSAVRDANRLTSYGYGVITTYNASALRFQFKAINAAGNDEIWLLRE